MTLKENSVINVKHFALIFVSAVGLISAGTTYAAGNDTPTALQSADNRALPATNLDAPAKSDAMSEGEIKKVDKETGKLTIKHGQLVNLAMPAMTMVFTVKDTRMLDQVVVGNKVKFVAEKVGGALMVTRLEATK